MSGEKGGDGLKWCDLEGWWTYWYCCRPKSVFSEFQILVSKSCYLQMLWCDLLPIIDGTGKPGDHTLKSPKLYVKTAAAITPINLQNGIEETMQVEWGRERAERRRKWEEINEFCFYFFYKIDILNFNVLSTHYWLYFFLRKKNIEVSTKGPIYKGSMCRLKEPQKCCWEHAQIERIVEKR